jgi:hypothetical protein
MRRVALASLVLTTLAGLPLEAQSKVDDLDLSKAVNDTAHVKPGGYRLWLVNKAPAAVYNLIWSRGNVLIEPIPFAMAMNATGCDDVKAKIKALREEKDETKVKNHTKAIGDAIAKVPAESPCKAEVEQAAKEVTAATVDSVDFGIAAGEWATISISKMDENKAIKRWERRYTTGPKGEWRASYGYAFPFLRRVHNWNRWVKDNAKHYSEEIDSATYLVVNKPANRSFDALPSILFAYSRLIDARVRLGWTGGIGTDINKPQMMTGPSLIIWSNLQLAAGVVFREEDVPSGRYSVGDTLSENLDSDNLQEKAMRLRPFVSITLRFDKNPFKSDKKEEEAKKEESSKPEEKKAEEKPPASPNQ